MDWYDGSGGNVSFNVNGTQTTWYCNPEDVTQIGQGNGTMHIDTQPIADAVSQLQYALTSNAQPAPVVMPHDVIVEDANKLLISVSFQKDHYEVSNNREAVFNKKLYVEMEKKDEKDTTFTEGSVVMLIAKGQMKSSGRQVCLLRDSDGNEALYFEEGLKSVKKAQREHFEKKYNVINNERVKIEDLIIIENS